MDDEVPSEAEWDNLMLECLAVDALQEPLNVGTQPHFSALRQLADGKGTRADTPLEGIGVEGSHAVLRHLGFAPFLQQATNLGERGWLDRVVARSIAIPTWIVTICSLVPKQAQNRGTETVT